MRNVCMVVASLAMGCSSEVAEQPPDPPVGTVDVSEACRPNDIILSLEEAVAIVDCEGLQPEASKLLRIATQEGGSPALDGRSPNWRLSFLTRDKTWWLDVGAMAVTTAAGDDAPPMACDADTALPAADSRAVVTDAMGRDPQPQFVTNAALEVQAACYPRLVEGRGQVVSLIYGGSVRSFYLYDPEGGFVGQCESCEAGPDACGCPTSLP